MPAKRLKREALAIQRRKTETVLVADGFQNPGFSKVEKIVDAADQLYRHHQVDADQHAAAQLLARAFEAVPGGLHCALATLGMSRSVVGPTEPSLAALRAAERLREARELLGELDFHLCRLILVDGLALSAVARRIFGARLSVRDVGHISSRFRLALDQLVDKWLGRRRRHFAVYRAADAKPVAGDAGEIQHSALHHATAHAGWRTVTR